MVNEKIEVIWGQDSRGGGSKGGQGKGVGWLKGWGGRG